VDSLSKEEVVVAEEIYIILRGGRVLRGFACQKRDLAGSEDPYTLSGYPEAAVHIEKSAFV